jgi:hypothetical protein
LIWFVADMLVVVGRHWEPVANGGTRGPPLAADLNVVQTLYESYATSLSP